MSKGSFSSQAVAPSLRERILGPLFLPEFAAIPIEHRCSSGIILRIADAAAVQPEKQSNAMELEAHFFNIHKVVIKHLELAHTEIVAAIAWFTDREIFDVLCNKARSGIKVSLALIGDEINRGPGGLNFYRLTNVGGHVVFLPPGSRDEPTMHHKFCVIDGNKVITGSYNWSQKARSNDENITVVSDSADFANRFLDTFSNLLVRVGHGTPVVADSDAARRRLEMIRHLILLGEQAEVSTHLGKLRPVADALQISRIIRALDNGEYKAALEYIGDYLRKTTALVASEYVDIARLRFQLESLELRLESLTDEKAELERLLITFNRRYDDALGDLIQSILKARAEQARQLAAERKNANERKAAEEAEAAYEDYSRQHEEMQRAEPQPKLAEEDERELKSLYRKACSLCHPDKMPVEKKEAAHRVFVTLQEAYKSNNLAGVRDIYEMLKNGGLPETRSSTLSEAEMLRAATAELEYTINQIVSELKALHDSDGARLMTTAGPTEADWQTYFVNQRKVLEKELATIVINA